MDDYSESVDEHGTFIVGSDYSGVIVAQKFTITSELGRGSFGIVYDAFDTNLKRPVALKLLFRSRDDPGELSRFIREGMVLAHLKHPSVVAVHEMGPRRDGTYYLALERLYGHNLRNVVESMYRMGIHEALDIITPIVSALVTLHDRQIVHRDLKPENIVLSQNDAGEIVPKVIDFGIAKPLHNSMLDTPRGMVYGTPAYAAPEQFRTNSPISNLADVWAVGIILYELLAGERPFGSDERTLGDCAGLRVLGGQKPPSIALRVSGLPATLIQLLDDALQSEPSRRPSIRHFRDVLSRLRAEARRSMTSSASLEDIVGTLPPIDGPPPIPETIPPPPPPLPPSPPPPVGPRVPPPVPTPDTDWVFETPLSAEIPSDARAMLMQAVRELSINALSAAVLTASSAMDAAKPYAELAGSLLLTRAIASYWIGDHDDSKNCAREALLRFEGDPEHWKRSVISTDQPLPPVMGAWYEALGHWALAAVMLGTGNELPILADRLRFIEQQDRPLSRRHVIAAYRLALSFGRTGNGDAVDKIYEGIERRASPVLLQEPLVRAWKAAALAQRMALLGNRERGLYLTHNAAKLFQQARDIRNNCLWSANEGNALMQIGQAAKAEIAISASLRLAEPMGLWFFAPVRVNLSLVLTRLGRVDEAIQVGKDALNRCERQGNRRFECVALIYLSMAYLASRNNQSAAKRDEALRKAEKYARDATNRAEDIPALRTYGQALLARIRLIQNQPMLALHLAKAAADHLERAGHFEECESLILLVYAQSLRETGKVDEGLARILEARENLLKQADWLRSDWRALYLEAIPEHAEIMRLSEQWQKAGSG